MEAPRPDEWNGERLFQAARFVTEMEYQHLVFEEFAPQDPAGIDPFNAVHAVSTPDIDPAIKAEFAHAVYRFGHSMLTETVVADEQTNGTKNDIAAARRVPEPARSYDDGSTASTLTPEAGRGSHRRWA